MKVSNLKPFSIVYALYEHQFLGFLFQAFAVQADDKGRLTLQHQNISRKNADEFSACLDKNDMRLISLMDEIQQEAVVKRFSPKKTTSAEFFFKVYDPNRGDRPLQEAIEEALDKRKAEIFSLLAGKNVYEMSNDGEPTYRRLTLAPEKASVLFHFRRNDDNTHYFPTVKYAGEKLEWQYQNAVIPCNHPAWLLLNGTLYSFEKDIDGPKLRPFLNKKFIVVPRAVEETYYRKFIAGLVSQFDVYAVGFEISTEKYKPVAQLYFKEVSAEKPVAVLFNDDGADAAAVPVSGVATEGRMAFELKFRYGAYTFPADIEVGTHVYPQYESGSDTWVFHRVQRHGSWEKGIISLLKSKGLVLQHGRAALGKQAAFIWMQNSLNNGLEQEGIKIIQEPAAKGPRYFLGYTGISVEITENRDWFDVFATVTFGTHEIPFLQLRKLILQKKREFKLPDGEIAVIPEAWFTQYTELFALCNEPVDGQGLTLPRFQVALVQELRSGNLAKVSISDRLQSLRDFRETEDYPMPEGFKGDLRPYQKAGYNWMRFLKDYGFGGCLADDMGLGKTVQTLALLLSIRTENTAAGQKARRTSLLVAPTSLIYNWEMEAKRFAPGLRILCHTGSVRTKDHEVFAYFDVVLSSYGIVRSDTELLAGFKFEYVILDESQAIKNPASLIAKSVQKLRAVHKLILTGTPLENSALDLWSQMNFINPGLIGTQTFFKNEFLNPIEKKGDENRTRRLLALIKPFILRRTKAQVASELPEKTEYIQYCSLTEEQEKVYEETRSAVRNRILEQIETKGLAGSQIFLLQGLMRLRQIANHPLLADPDYKHDSGKLTDVLHKLESVVRENHKVLVFSQFVKHLSLLRSELDKRGIAYAYLDGSSTDRREQVESFQNRPELPLFLISLKAGGTGLNLTAADYVFLLDPWWNPAAEAQAIDRAHRIGQDKKVFIYKFITRNTVEEKILGLQRHKQKLFSNLITDEAGIGKVLTEADVMELLS